MENTNKINAILDKHITQEMIQLIASKPLEKDLVVKIKLRPIKQGEEILFQASSFIGVQVFHKNYTKKEVVSFLGEAITHQFQQVEIQTISHNVTILISKKGKITIKEKRNQTTEKEIDFSHNRTKKYLLEEGTPIGFLIDLGIQDADGKILKSKYDKYRQINRFLEFIDDIIPALKKEGRIHILDFGCGKSYLTFAMYHFLKVVKGMNISITGLDLKSDVIHNCNLLSQKYQYENLKFLHGDIAEYKQEDQIDMVVTLHACDTATDFALQKAVLWGAKVILSVPCCQHELNQQISCDALKPILKYGLIKERIAALATDAIRAEILEGHGYEVQILEFIDMEHTPKNILIRAVKRKGNSERQQEEQQDMLTDLFSFLQIDPTLNKLLNRK